ncbi:MAG: hypothetical protein Q8O74_07535, partial [bacterium]|nr:hypothetical protein [bacterium]
KKIILNMNRNILLHNIFSLFIFTELWQTLLLGHPSAEFILSVPKGSGQVIEQGFIACLRRNKCLRWSYGTRLRADLSAEA